MHLEIFSLCDAATADTGKLNILGAFDTIWVTTMPVVFPQCTIALRVRFDSIEKGQHQVIVDLVDLDGRHLIPPANGAINVNFDEGQRSAASNLILNIHGLKLEKCGEYSINLAIDGRQEASLPFFVRERK
ncbi:MAG: hypothetical protein ABH865_04960 [Candidatus Omnitrophota bacterium]|nr:hypothetical protein [Candidatus Omnitrophota bacterium]